MNTDIQRRRYELDWIRITAILVVFIYHSSRFFNLGDWHVKNINTYVWVETWNRFATLWMMPLFFVISGAGLFFALRKISGWKDFYINKFSRLMVPVIFASVTHSAVQVYFERVTHGQFSGSFLDFFPGYFSGLYFDTSGSGNFAFHGMHLWYLLFLFIYSILCYRLFTWFAGNGQQLLNRITNLSALSGLMYLCFPFPLLMMKLIIPNSVLNVGSGGWGFLYYLWFLISGFIIISSDRLTKHIEEKRKMSLLLAGVFTSIQFFQLFSLAGIIFPVSISPWIGASLRYISAWCWIFAIFGYGMKYLSFNRPILRHLNEGVLPFYILHQTVLLGVGVYIMKMAIHDVLKWSLVSGISFLLIISLYILFIRKFELLRFLFGMKTSHPFFSMLLKRNSLVIMHLFYIGLIVFSIINPVPGFNKNRSPIPIAVDKEKDIILDSKSITNLSQTGVRITGDDNASTGQAIEFFSGAAPRPLSDPEVYAEMRFSAPAGRYVVWLRGKSDKDSIESDSIWLQADEQIGTHNGQMLGNWLDIHPVGKWSWASNGNKPMAVLFKHGGEHTIRIQPRQTPHRIDQIWLSRFQHQIPNTIAPIK